MLSALPSDQVRACFYPPEVTADSRDLDSLDALKYETDIDRTPPALPVQLARAVAEPDGRVAVITDPAVQPGWHLADHEVRQPLNPTSARTITAGPLQGPVVRVTDHDGIPLSGPAVIDDPAALDRALRENEDDRVSDQPAELTETDLDTPLGAALQYLHRHLIMDLNEQPTAASGGGLGSDEAGAESDDNLWERLERETLQRDPRVGTYERIISRSQPGDPLAEHIIELLESMRARVPAGILDNPGSLLNIINRAQPQTSNGKSGYHWSTTARTRVRTRNVLRRLAAAQTDRRLEWVNPIAPLLNLISVAVVLTWLWLAQAEPGATIELEPDDLDDLWARWFQPFVGTGHEDGWTDRSELSDAEVHKQAGDNLSEMVTLLCWLAIRPGPDRRGRVIRWQPTLRAAIRHDLIDDTAEVAVAAATVAKHPVSRDNLPTIFSRRSTSSTMTCGVAARPKHSK